MPSLFTHYIFLKRKRQDFSNIALLGSQGPDPFFFYFVHIPQSKKIKKVCALGSTLHKIDPANIFIEFIKIIEEETSVENKRIIQDFLIGLMAHYSLDRTTHPYIFYKSGFNVGEENNKRFFTDHSRLESYIDALIMNKENIFPSIKEVFRISKADLKIVSKSFYKVIKKIINIDEIDENTYYEAIKRMKFTYNVLYSKTGIKNSIFRKIANNTPLESFSNPAIKNIPSIDYLNLNHVSYKDCVTGEERGKKDFFDLMDEGFDYFKKLESVLYSFNSLKEKENTLFELTSSINHDGFTVGMDKIYYQSFFK